MRHGRQDRMRSWLEAAHVRLAGAAHAPTGTTALAHVPSVDGAAWHHPLGLLPRDGRDQLEVGVVVQDA